MSFAFGALHLNVSKSLCKAWLSSARSPHSHFSGAGLLAVDYLRCHMSKRVVISPVDLRNAVARYGISEWQFFPPVTLAHFVVPWWSVPLLPRKLLFTDFPLYTSAFALLWLAMCPQYLLFSRLSVMGIGAFLSSSFMRFVECVHCTNFIQLF